MLMHLHLAFTDFSLNFIRESAFKQFNVVEQAIIIIWWTLASNHQCRIIIYLPIIQIRNINKTLNLLSYTHIIVSALAVGSLS
ncbi:hypothetical protein FGO68_gene12094 [Halteria grandinella]|uniref:Uncharacterized protein n=1 Tax=Halteria grandinella TaxID=5974 RepID=A0A8J8NQX4_HALGN|nr:hypothetical protein FGO68_gene12094 [Halteria grandinella]